MDVEYSGIPTPTITWKKDGKPLEDLSVIETRETITKLTVSKLELSHAGQYTVTAENSVGRDMANFAIDVKGKDIISSYLNFP